MDSVNENTNTQEKTQKENLKRRIPYDKEVFIDETTYEQVIDDLLEDSKNIALSQIYSFDDYSELELPKKYNNWQLRACVELYNLADKSMFVNYSENSLSFSRLTDGLSRNLMSELMPKVGIPKRKVVEDEDNVQS